MTWPQYLRGECSVSGIVKLSPMEADVLLALLVRYPEPVPVGDLIECCYPDPDAEPDWAEGNIHAAIARLRRTLGDQFLKDHCRLGYRLLQPREAGAAANDDAIIVKPGQRLIITGAR